MYHGERFNSITHLAGACLAVVGAAVLIVVAARMSDPWKLISFSVYGATLVTLYVASTLYHSVRGRAKNILRKVDHCSIYLLIAGTYTPFALVSLRGVWGWSLLGVVWALALFGILQEIWSAKGARVLLGGERPSGPGWFYPPTLIVDLTPDMRMYVEEVFGPVAGLFRVASLDEAIALVNDNKFGLGSNIWTDDPDEQAQFIDESEAGMVFVNGMTSSYPELPFGGIKNSGYGRELSVHGIREFCNLKTVWVGANGAG